MSKLDKLLRLTEDKQTLNLTLKVGDILKIGKFKNRTAIIKGFGIDKNNQPTVKTDKGIVSVFKFRLSRLMETL